MEIRVRQKEIDTHAHYALIDVDRKASIHRKFLVR
jgi:hypothetical protein